jgi:hypothetical protein
MAKAAPDNTIDTLLDYVALSTVMHICSAEPATYAGIAAISLGSVTMAPGDFTKADAAGGGRQVTVGAKSGVPVSASGTATHIVLATVTGSVYKYTTTCTSQALVSGNTANVPAWVITVGDPT